ncbi:MAG: TGS domain-containing protein, partial [Chloroflexi bacterium]|nr:TGS domain-containing protein [Chloroflexota bacterium]
GQLEESLALLREQRIAPVGYEGRIEDDRRWTFVPMLVVANKVDDQEAEELFELFQELLEEEWPMVAVSAETGRGLDELKKEVFERLGIIRVYAKPPGQRPDLDAPFVLRRGATVEEFAGRVHKDFLEQLVAARVWGSAEYDGQMVGRDHVLQDGDIVELRT